MYFRRLIPSFKIEIGGIVLAEHLRVPALAITVFAVVFNSCCHSAEACVDQAL